MIEEISRVLAKAERYAKKCEAVIAEQRALVSQYLINGWDASQPFRVLAEMELTYGLIVAERDRIRGYRARVNELHRERAPGEALN